MSDTIKRSVFPANDPLVLAESMKINPRTVTGFDGPSGSSVDEVAIVQTDIDGNKESRTFFYIVPKIGSYDLIVGLPWMKQNEVIMDAGNASLTIGTTGSYVQNRAVTAKDDFNHLMGIGYILQIS